MPSNIQQYKNYIILHNVGFQDSRYYICTATNAAGSTIKAIHLVVISRRKLLPLSVCVFVFENTTVRVRVWSITPLSKVLSWRSGLLMEETGIPGENHRPVTSNWQTYSHNVVSSTPRMCGIRTHNVSGD